MVKKIGVFITILGLFFVGVPQFNTNALIYNGVDYRILETGTPIQTNDGELHTVVISGEYGGSSLASWLNYMQYNDIYRIEMQASDLSTFYFYIPNDNSSTDIVDNAIKVVIGYDTGVAWFYVWFYGLNQEMIAEYVFANSQNDWVVPSDTKLLTDVSYQTNSNLYGDGYNDGFNDGKSQGLEQGYEDGYFVGINEADLTGFVGLLGGVFGGLGSLLAIELLPGIHIGAIIAVPLVFGIIFFIIGKKKE